jgi:hypothetical protein
MASDNSRDGLPGVAIGGSLGYDLPTKVRVWQAQS